MRDYAYHATLTLRTRFFNALRRPFRWGPLERWLARRVSGREPRSFWGRMVPSEYLYPHGSWRAVERNGVRYRLDLSNTTDHAAYFGFGDLGDASFQGLLEPGDTVVDIGANIGIRSLAFARRVSPGVVVSLEPHPDTYSRLREHVELNRADNIVAVNLGVGPDERSRRLYEVVTTNSGMNRIVSAAEGMAGVPFRDVALAPLDRILDRLGIRRVDAIKMDVEGYEMEALRGCVPVIERDRPLLFVEVDDDNLRENRSSAGALLKFIDGLGYAIREAVSGSSPPQDLSRCHFDVIATPVTAPRSATAR